jgi:hypothetical protein
MEEVDLSDPQVREIGVAIGAPGIRTSAATPI